MSLGPIMMDLAGQTIAAEERERLLHPNVGGVILFARNYSTPEQLRALCEDLRGLKRTKRLLIAVDHEGGRVQRFRHGFSRVPAMRRLGEQYRSEPDAALAAAYEHGRVIASELSGFGIDLAFAPVVDRDRGVSAVIGDRAFSDDPDTIVALASAFCRGQRSGGQAPTIKHFPGHGAVAADSHTELPIDRRTLETVLREDADIFRRLIDDGAESLMMAHVRYPAYDDLPASLSRRWIREILRKRYGFKGVVFCDDLSMHGARVIDDPVERAELALSAGCDMVPICNDPDTAALVIDGLAQKRRAGRARLPTLYSTS